MPFKGYSPCLCVSLIYVRDSELFLSVSFLLPVRTRAIAVALRPVRDSLHLGAHCEGPPGKHVIQAW